jgi:hypothetical protein
MSEPVENLVERLHAKCSGDGWKAKCPVHDDREPSISISEGADGRALLKCHAGCETNDVLAAIGMKPADLFVVAGKNGSRPPKQRPRQKMKDENATPINWQTCVEAFSEKHLERLSDWRGYSGRFCSWLHKRGLVGLCENCIAFPVHDKDGLIIAAHCRPKSDKWFYKPGTPVQPFIIGDLETATQVHVFESQWDMFAFMDRTELYEEPTVAFVATRGAGNAKLIKGLLREGVSVCAWPQNDELNDHGKRAGDEWLKDLAFHADVPIAKAIIPPPHEDMNAWCQAGATAEDIYLALFKNELVEVPKPPGLGMLLGEICEFLRRFIVFESDTQPIICALWVAHAWAIDAFDFTPYLNVGSPEKRAGKTQLLECLNQLVRKPWLTLSVTEAVLFREIDKSQPTLLLDESDALFKKGGGNDDRREPIRALLNAGFKRGAMVPRCMGSGNFEVQHFKVFCAKAFAGIGTLPDTIADRSLPIRLTRKSRGETVERLRDRNAKILAQPIVNGLEAWSKREDVIKSLNAARPAEIPELSDRQADICEPLLAIAEMAGGDWRERARKALVAVCSSDDDDDSLGTKLLAAIRDVFSDGDTDRIATKELLRCLVEQETDAPWAHWWEEDLRKENTRGPAARLAGLLKPFRIKPRVIRLPDESTPRGYMREDFEKLWRCYCPEPP